MPYVAFIIVVECYGMSLLSSLWDMSKGIGMSGSPIVIDSENEGSPVKVAWGDKFRANINKTIILC